MSDIIFVVKKSWKDDSIPPNVIKYKCIDYNTATTMYSRLLRKYQYNSSRNEFIDISLIENDNIREHVLFEPIRSEKIKYQPVIKRKELWNVVKK